jgi:hypothetical protein
MITLLMLYAFWTLMWVFYMWAIFGRQEDALKAYFETMQQHLDGIEDLQRSLKNDRSVD